MYLKAHKNSAESSWQRKLDELLKLHPNLANEEDSDNDEDSQRLSLVFSSTSSDDEWKENNMAVSKKNTRQSKRDVVTRNKSKV